MRVHVVLTPAELGPDLHSQTAVVIDVFRAATTMVTALTSGCRAIVPALTPEEARERARAFPRGEVLLAGEAGEPSLEDTVCAGLIVDALAGAGALELSDTAVMARGTARDYRPRLDDLRAESQWGRHLARRGRQQDLATCLALDAWTAVPLFRDGHVTPAQP